VHHSSARRRALGLLALFGVLFTIYASTTSRDHTNDDVYGAALASWRIGATGAPWLEGVDTEAIGLALNRSGSAAEAVNGHLVVKRSPGVIAVAVPAYWLSGQGADPRDFTLGPNVLTASALAALSVLLFRLSIVDRMSRPAGWVATLAFGLATPVWSVAANGVWTHTVTVFGLTGMAWAASRERWWLVGLFGGVALWGRLHVALIVAIVGLGVAVSRRRPGIAVAVGGVSAVFMGLASVWSHWVYGTWSPAGGYVDQAEYLEEATLGGVGGFWETVANEFGMWVSADRGILVWTPVLLVLLAALVRSWRELPDWSRWLLIGGVVYTLAQGRLAEFQGGDGYYGYRHGLEFLACAAPAFALSAVRMGRVAQALVGPVLALQFAAIAVGAISDGFFVYRQDAWVDNSYWLALRHRPLVWVWTAIVVAIGVLGTRVWRERTQREHEVVVP
jgi:alpha-1,2-mannosyltransferase